MSSRTTIKKAVFEFLNLSEEDKELILKIAHNTNHVKLAPLDKGLSGSVALLAKWEISGQETKFHVLKIGSARKLKEEHRAMSEFAAPLTRHFPQTNYEELGGGADRGIISQEFVGDDRGVNKSLKQFIEQSGSPDEIPEAIDQLYSSALSNWFKPPTNSRPERRPRVELGQELARWLHKGPANAQAMLDIADQTGRPGLESSLQRAFGLSVSNIGSMVDRFRKQKLGVKRGPAHGDLHAQNVVFDFDNKICLIDFGWTGEHWQAVDFIWLECSLKFVVCTPFASAQDLISLEKLLDSNWGKEERIDYSETGNRMHGGSLTKIVAAIAAVRRNARDAGVVSTLEEYRQGLILMTYGLLTVPQLNQANIFHSLAYNLVSSRLYKRKGPYDQLYASRPLLWPDRPGRMVVRAERLVDSPGRCLDLGCGDGKNLVHLVTSGWEVDGIDISPWATTAAETRLKMKNIEKGWTLHTADVCRHKLLDHHYDMVVSYGLLHCLNDEEVQHVHQQVLKCLKPGGLLVFAAFNDRLPLPSDHHTQDIHLRPADHIFRLTEADFDVLDKEDGQIVEDHLPLVKRHRHSLTWAVLKRRI